MDPGVRYTSCEHSVASQTNSNSRTLDILQDNCVSCTARVIRGDEGVYARDAGVDHGQGARCLARINTYGPLFETTSQEDDIGGSCNYSDSRPSEGEIFEHPLLAAQLHADTTTTER